MDEKTKAVLLQAAGYLRMIAEGYTPTPSPTEAQHLLNKIGDLFSDGEPIPA